MNSTKISLEICSAHRGCIKGICNKSGMTVIRQTVLDVAWKGKTWESGSWYFPDLTLSPSAQDLCWRCGHCFGLPLWGQHWQGAQPPQTSGDLHFIWWVRAQWTKIDSSRKHPTVLNILGNGKTWECPDFFYSIYYVVTIVINCKTNLFAYFPIPYPVTFKCFALFEIQSHYITLASLALIIPLPQPLQW